MKLIFKVLIPAFILGLSIAFCLWLFESFEEKARPTPPQAVKLVQSVVVSPSENAYPITAFGKLINSSPVDLISEVNGQLQAGAINFTPGQSFRKGDILLRIDDRQAALNLNSTKSDFLNALATVLPEIKIDFPEEFPVWERYFNSCDFESKLDELPEAPNQKIKLFLSRFNVYKLYFSIKQLEIDLEKHQIRAPFAGSISSADLRVGSNVRSGTRIGRIISTQQREVEISVPAENVNAIVRSQAVKLSSSEIAGSWTGRIIRIGNVIDERTQSLPVYVSLSGNDRAKLFDGVFLQAEFAGKPVPQSVLVPRKAVYENSFIYLVNNGLLEVRPIQIGRSLNDNLIVSGGLNQGDTLVTDVLQGAYAGMPARAVVIAHDNEAARAASEVQQ